MTLNSTDTAVRVRDLTKRYGRTPVVDGLDLDIAHGEVFALLGPNGAGKTTTVEILEGHRARDGGSVSVLGEDPARAGRAWRSRIGIVPQQASDAADLTVREVVRHFAKTYPRHRDPDAVIEQVGLGEHARKRVGRLSGGQRRRVDVALGIVGDPDLLFLDEPTTGFDPEARSRFWELIRRLSFEGTTILLTTHYLDEVEALAHRVAVVDRGRLKALGDPQTLGGRADAAAVVSWQQDGRVVRRETTDPDRLVAELVAHNSDNSGRVAGLSVHRPSLEDIYLRLIGASGPEHHPTPGRTPAPGRTSA
ncbi:ABC transporter ATP-binding protein [Streptomyces sp. NBC_00237]|uniref:ABC transporter ATP-binding protein n=1 Tax=Streptomyces sp. NBC_00237 TaxID=2975687 RepID=UPI002259301B|nr:ABC transporter ATP-binding protein [Streptomyces sp. NBC_00237]MCX5206619.1 ABC transporter ATP-binding protein [Streptomyces sp. NBC_00237]